MLFGLFGFNYFRSSSANRLEPALHVLQAPVQKPGLLFCARSQAKQYSISPASSREAVAGGSGGTVAEELLVPPGLRRTSSTTIRDFGMTSSGGHVNVQLVYDLTASQISSGFQFNYAFGAARDFSPAVPVRGQSPALACPV